MSGPRIELAIRNGWVVDGTGAPRRKIDVGIIGNRVVEVGQVPEAETEIDASGLTVSPGFIDPHSHTDWTVHSNRDAESTIRQGVTTEIVGNCGITNAPVSELSLESTRIRMHAYGYDGPISWRSFGDYLADVEAGGTAQNLAFFVGHSTIRDAAGVASDAPSEQQLVKMENLVREAMEAGALGMSSGLEYSLGAFASTAELQRLSRIVGRYGGIYASHIRNRDAKILDSVGEFLAIMEDGDAAGQISHLNVRHDTNAPERGWERAVELMTAARDRGFDVQADTTPFRQGVGIMTGILPNWLLADGYPTAVARLGDPLVRAKVREESDRYWRFIQKGQWDRVRLQNSPEFPELNGRYFTDIARLRNQDVWDSYFDVLAAAGDNMGNLIMIGDLFTEEHLKEMVSHPLFSLGVDAYSSVDHGPMSDITVNPLPYSGHVHYLTHHVRETGNLTLEEAVRKMSGMPAKRFGLKGRGLVREGYFADLVVFDFEGLRTESSFEHPARYPEGIALVTVNGTIAVDRDGRTDARSGRVLRR